MMTTGTDALAQAFRDYNTAGVPSSGAHEPDKFEIRSALKQLGLEVSAGTLDVEVYATIAARNADTAQAAGTLGYVYRNNGSASDPANGFYQWTGSTWEAAAWIMSVIAAASQPLIDDAVDDATTAAAKMNVAPDPFFRVIQDDPVLSPTINSWTSGSIITADPDSPWGGNTISNPSGALTVVRKYYRLSDLPFQPGDVTSWLVMTKTAEACTVSVSYRNAAGADISGGQDSDTAAAGVDTSHLTATVPANAAYVSVELLGDGAKKIVAIAANRGPNPPGFTEAPTKPVSAESSNLDPDPYFRLAVAGVRRVEGYRLLGDNGAATLTAAPSGSPIKGSVLFLPTGTIAFDTILPLAGLKLEVGHNVFRSFGLWANQVVDAEFTWRNAAGAVIGSTVVAQIDPRPGATGTDFGYAELVGNLPVTDAVASGAVSIWVRMFAQGVPVGPSGCYILARGLSRSRARLIDRAVVTDAIRKRAMGSVPSPHVGKTIIILGDSVPGDTNRGGYYLSDGISDLLGCTVVNCAIGGTTLASRTDADYNALSGASLIQAWTTGNWTAVDAAAANVAGAPAKVARLKANNPENVHGVVLMYGTNDYGAEQKAMGADGDTTPATFKGAIRYAVQTLHADTPLLRILFCTPLYRDRFDVQGDGKNGDTFQNSQGLTLTAYVDAILSRAGALHVPVADLYRLAGFNSWNYYGTTGSPGPLTNDGLHPNDSVGLDRLIDVTGRAVARLL